MKQTQIEILLFTDTRFASRQFCERFDKGNQNYSSSNQGLEEACWNGLFQEVLPELYMDGDDGQKLTLWKITQANHFLELDYGEQLQYKERTSSMNPYFFLGYWRLS